MSLTTCAYLHPKEAQPGFYTKTIMIRAAPIDRVPSGLDEIRLPMP